MEDVIRCMFQGAMYCCKRHLLTFNLERDCKNKKDMNSRIPTPITKFEWEKQASENKLKTHQSSGRRLALIMPQALQVTNTTMRPRNGQ